MDQERDQNPTQPAVALGQMMEGVAAMQREQAAFNRQFLGMLQNQKDHLAVHPGGQGGGSRSPTLNRPTPAPRRRVPPQHHNQAHAQPPPAPRSNTFSSHLFPPQVPAATRTAPNPQETTRMPGQECWRCGQLGHFREACPLMEVGQVIRVASPATLSPGAGATY